MNIFFSRLPYLIEVNEDPLQIATKIELFIWELDGIEPTNPTHVVERESFSPTQYVGSYNISPFVDDKMKNINRPLFLKVKTYYKLTTTWIYIDATELISARGYENGSPTLTGYYVLESFADNRYYLTTDPIINASYTGLKINILFDFDTYSELRVRYFNDLNEEIVYYEETGIKYLTIPKSTYYSGDFAQGNSFELSYYEIYLLRKFSVLICSYFE
jgi:hypothetical protein